MEITLLNHIVNRFWKIAARKISKFAHKRLKSAQKKRAKSAPNDLKFNFDWFNGFVKSIKSSCSSQAHSSTIRSNWFRPNWISARIKNKNPNQQTHTHVYVTLFYFEDGTNKTAMHAQIVSLTHIYFIHCSLRFY